MPEQPAKIDYMQEVFAVFLDWLRKQASQVMLLSFGMAFMYYQGTKMLNEAKETIFQQEVKMAELREEVRKCDMERATLSERVNGLELQLQLYLERSFRRQKN